MKKGPVEFTILVIGIAFLFFILRFGSLTGNVVSGNSNLIETGFDPGLKIARISSPFSPSNSFYYENCPNDIGGKCYGNVPAGSGFYTLSWDNQLCKPNTGQLYNSDQGNSQVPCPFYFAWKNEGNNLIANLKVNTFNHKSAITRNNYLGMQTNIASGLPYYGLNFNNITHSPYIENITNISIQFRAKLCYNSNLPDTNPHGRITYYVGWWNVQKQKGESLSIDFIQFWKSGTPKPTSLVSNYSRESDLAGLNPSDPNYYGSSYHTIYVNGKYYGVVPQNYDFYLDTTPDCSYNISNLPFYEVNIPVKSILQDLVSKNLINQTILTNAKYNGGIIGGIETWGRNLVELDVKDHHVYLNSILKANFKGHFDKAFNNKFPGWVCDANAPNETLAVHFYYDRPASGKPDAITSANIVAEQAVGNLCGGNNKHRFAFNIPDKLKDGQQHKIYAYAVKYQTTNEVFQLIGSPINYTYVAIAEDLLEDSPDEGINNNLPPSGGAGDSGGESTSSNDTELTTTESQTSSTDSINDETGTSSNAEDNTEEKSSTIKTFFVKIVCRISNLFSSSAYETCKDKYIN